MTKRPMPPIGEQDEPARQISALRARLADAEATIVALRVAAEESARGRRSPAPDGKTRTEGRARLEDRVRERTRELTILNEELKTEIADRIRVEEVLRAETEARKASEVDLRALNVALAESEERFRSLVESVPIGICIVRDGVVVFANPEQERLLGALSGAEASGPFLKVHPEDAEAFDALSRAVAPGAAAAQEADIRLLPCAAEDEEPRWVRVKAGKVRYQGRSALLLTMLDITQAKRLEHVAAVQERLASLGQLSAGIAHEIRNPLSGINIYLSTLDQLLAAIPGVDRPGEVRLHEITDQIRGASTKIAQVIERILSFSRPAPEHRDAVDLNRVLDEAVSICDPALRRGGIAVSVVRAAGLPECRVDPHLILQVLVNLISNAVQAMEARAAPKRLQVSTAVENAGVVVRVSDSGPGVPARMRIRIFEPFYTTRKDGYGIGLYFSHRVVTAHGGSLTVGTSRWGGAEFRMEIPVGEAASGT